MSNNGKISGTRAGFTLIEMMVVTTILGILMVPITQMYMNARKLSEDHLLFTRASSALARQAEIIRSTPYAELKPGDDRKLDRRVAALIEYIPGAGGGIDIKPLEDEPGVKWVTVRVGWENPWGKEKTIHTVVVRSAP